ncbi:YceI family protein [Profundibacter sp.]|uniref:YceI family protein n=1 Tax=Profundibacter sp. TaxID=3101071 RepID=UPI003D0E3333
MKLPLIAVALASLVATSAAAAPEKYILDNSHSQVVFSYNHLGFSTTWSMFSGFGGEIMFDADAPASSSVSVSMPLKSMYTGWEKRFKHFMSPDFFDAKDDSTISFTSTGIEITGEKTALITGDLVINGVSKSVVLDAVLNQAGEHPMVGKPWLGFNATTKLLRSDFGVGKFAPYVGDELNVMISIEAMKAE